MDSTFGFTLDRKGAKAALGHAARVTERRNTIPILSCVRFDVRPDFVLLTATDLDMELSHELPAATSGQGVLILPLDALKTTVGKFTGEFVRIESLGGDRVAVTCTATGARAILTARKADDWP